MLGLSTKSRYAARIMVAIARHTGPAPVTKQSIATEEDISANYIEQILMRLRASGLVYSHRGRYGGFSLGKPAEAITLYDVIKAVEGPIQLVPCIRNVCQRKPKCPTEQVWARATQALENILSETTIQDIANCAATKQVGNADYHI